MPKRQVFYSFYYAPDNWRVSQFKDIGQIENNNPLGDNKWQEIKKKGQKAIQEWIDENLKNCSCTIIMVGENTANRKWIDYEIKKSWNDKKGLVGIYIHNLNDSNGDQSNKGKNPFIGFTFGTDNKKLSSVLQCYDPPFVNSKNAYHYIKENIKDWIEEAIEIRNRN